MGRQPDRPEHHDQMVVATGPVAPVFAVVTGLTLVDAVAFPASLMAAAAAIDRPSGSPQAIASAPNAARLGTERGEVDPVQLGPTAPEPRPRGCRATHGLTNGRFWDGLRLG